MTYRDPAPRQPRLWFVFIGMYNKAKGKVAAQCADIWALESHHAIEALVSRAVDGGTISSREECFFRHAICGEEFAELEAKGPPKKETP